MAKLTTKHKRILRDWMFGVGTGRAPARIQEIADLIHRNGGLTVFPDSVLDEAERAELREYASMLSGMDMLAPGALQFVLDAAETTPPVDVRFDEMTVDVLEAPWTARAGVLVKQREPGTVRYWLGGEIVREATSARAKGLMRAGWTVIPTLPTAKGASRG